MKSIVFSILASTSFVTGVNFFEPSSALAGPFREREINQQQRIYQGVNQGSISPQEFKNLGLREAKIEAQRQNYLSDGNLTVQEAYRLNQAQNRTSRAIYRDRHN